MLRMRSQNVVCYALIFSKRRRTRNLAGMQETQVGQEFLVLKHAQATLHDPNLVATRLVDVEFEGALLSPTVTDVPEHFVLEALWDFPKDDAKLPRSRIGEAFRYNQHRRRPFVFPRLEHIAILLQGFQINLQSIGRKI